jgi:hypothetical protein
MIAHFYILAESFQNNSSLSNNDIEEKVKRLAEDIKLIHKYKETNKLYANYEEIYLQIFYAHYTVEDFICTPQKLKQNGIDRDVINALQNILQKSEETKITSQEAKHELLSWIDENNCHGLIAFHKIEGFDDNLQVIYGIDGWYKFRRYFLGKYPKDENFFIDECIKYFPISIYANLDETATLEGNAQRKEYFTFSFANNLGADENVCCEPHLKLCYSDKDNSYSNDRRIYFHEGKSNIQNGRILVGHIGVHL